MMYFKPYFEEFPLVLNHPRMVVWLQSQVDTIAAIAATSTKKVTGHNAMSMIPDVDTYSGPWRDRAVGTVTNINTDYGAQRELGGHANPKPERAIFHAMQAVSGGKAVASPKERSAVRRAKKRKPFLSADKYENAKAYRDEAGK